MKRPWIWVLVVVLLALGGGLYLWQPWTTSAVESPGGTLGPTARVERGDIVKALTAFGEVVPKDMLTLDLSTKEFAELRVKDGDVVEQGQVLAALPNTKEELALLRAERALALARTEGIPSVIREKELEYELAKETYDNTFIRAPFPAVVAEEISRYPSTGATEYRITLLNRDELFIEAEIPELEVPELAPGQTGTATIDALPGRTWPVEIVRVGQRAVQDPSYGGGKVVPVVAKLLKTDPTILPGFSARIMVITAAARGVLRVPIEALWESGLGWAVYVVDEGKPSLRPVEVGLTTDQYAEIVSGLEEGEEILLYPGATTPTTSPAQRVIIGP